MCDCEHKGYEVMGLSGTEVMYEDHSLAGMGMGDINVGDYTTDASGNVIGIPGVNVGAGSGFNWGSLITPIVQSGTRVFESIYTARPTYAATTGPGGQSSTTLWGAAPGGISTLGSGFTTPSITTLALLGIGAVVLIKVFSGKH